ncbi:SMI1/KNR4 family protein [Paenibacillus sp. PR3]|uniref:SMI1/KNR4 family protein n=1 Tax=Paenibacillus terricola TaxID=2763503 RepID=A0ABR8N4X5_9BACL|nr:SMI1/KNR4 family protein [Paenibacillus terricola]MBD3922930.1 SMI1/KNR4 family protein [Paenibacillus terricola]
MMPKQVIDFYSVCGGLSLFKSSDNCIEILPPMDVLPSNKVILSEETYNELLLDEELDISMNWYTIGRYDCYEYISIDFSIDRNRAGRCYDSFHETHAISGSNQIITKSLEELIERAFINNGEYPYFWLRDDFESIGDAYED